MEKILFPYTPTLQLPPGNALILAPHPDDEVFGCAGAIMQHLAQNDQVTVLIVTDGSAAIEHATDTDRLNYITLRKQESQQAATILGYDNLLFWDVVDSTLVANESRLQQLLFEIQQRQIINLYAPSLVEIHPDHFTLAELAVNAAIQHPADMNLIQYEIGIPLYPNILLDITAIFSRKQEAMHCFASQLALHNYTRHLSSLNIYRSYSLPARVQAAEAYYLLHNNKLKERPYLRFGHTTQTLLLEKLARQSEERTEQLYQLQQTVESLYRSRSWRITKPLRWLSQRVWKLGRMR